MYRILVTLFVCVPLLSDAQIVQKGIHFENISSWEEICSNAKKQGKYIFVDCHASWCVPCKQMDKSVYSDDSVGVYANEYFIAVKMQMDTSLRDNDYVKKKYATAHYIKNQYDIAQFPTYLFFSPDGKIVHREMGFMPPPDFLSTLRDAMDSQKQVYTLVSKYENGDLDYNLLPNLVKESFFILRDKQLAFQLADDYNKNYLNKLTVEQLFNRENIEFVSSYLKVLHSKDKYFNLFYHYGSRIDSIMDQPGFASKFVDKVITLEEINPKIYKDGKAVAKALNWKDLFVSIQKKYGKERAEECILNAQISWYEAKKDWKNSIRYNIEKIEKYGIDTTFWGRFFLNNMLYNLILFHCDDNTVLNKSIKWMEMVLDAEHYSSAESLDTYANLLYKSRKRKEGLAWEERASKLSPDDGEIKDHLELMKKNLPTWVPKK